MEWTTPTGAVSAGCSVLDRNGAAHFAFAVFHFVLHNTSDGALPFQSWSSPLSYVPAARAATRWNVARRLCLFYLSWFPRARPDCVESQSSKAFLPDINLASRRTHADPPGKVSVRLRWRCVTPSPFFPPSMKTQRLNQSAKTKQNRFSLCFSLRDGNSLLFTAPSASSSGSLTGARRSLCWACAGDKERVCVFACAWIMTGSITFRAAHQGALRNINLEEHPVCATTRTKMEETKRLPRRLLNQL